MSKRRYGMASSLDEAIERARQAHSDYDQRSHRGDVTDLLIEAGVAPDRIVHVVTGLAGYNDNCVLPPSAVAVLWGTVKSRETWLATQMQKLKAAFG